MTYRFTAIAATALMVLTIMQTGADVPARVNYQGRLIDGTNLVNGTKTFLVRIYDDASGGNLLYTETNTNITVQDGLYAMTIGDETGFSDALTNTALYLELEVDSQTLSPREQITSVPYAMMAADLPAGTITANHLTGDAVEFWAIANDAVASSHIQDGSITGSDMASKTIQSGNIGDGQVTSLTIANGTIVAADIASQTITGSEIAANAISFGHIVNGTIRETDLADDAVTQAKIADDAVDSDRIADGSVASTDIKDGDVTSTDIKDATIANVDLAASAVNSSTIQDGSILTADIATGQITGNRINWPTMPTGLQDGDDVGIMVETDPVYTNDKPTIVFDGDTAGGDLSGTYPNPQIATGAIVNVDISATAAIDGSKVQSGSTNNQGTVTFAPGAVAPYLAIDDSDARLNGFASVNTFAATSPTGQLSIVGGNGVTVTDTVPNTIKIELGNLKLDNVMWVALNGTAAGPGTYDSPFNDPQVAYNAAVAAYPAQPAVVAIVGGRYSPALTMTAGNVHIQGFARPRLTALTVTSPAHAAIGGKVRVQGIVLQSQAVVTPDASDVKFHNCRFEDTMLVLGSNVEFQDCQIAASHVEGSGGSAGLEIGGAETIRNIGVYNSAIQWCPVTQPGSAALLVHSDVLDLEVNGCEIVSKNESVPAIRDLQTTAFEPPNALHLFCHNYIKGPTATESSTAAVIDTASSTIAFHHNVVYGNVGLSSPVTSQYVTHCAVYGRLWWNLAGAWYTTTSGYNMHRNPSHTPSANLPDPWDD